MPQSFLDQLHQLQTFPQLQQQPNQSPAPAAPAASAEAEPDDLELDPSELAPDDDDHDVAETAESSQPVAPAAGPDPLRAERRRNNQLEKELRTLRTQLARFSEINPDEYARLQETERQKQELERQIQQRESQLSDAHTRRVRTVEKERDDARQQILDLRKERLLERLFHDAEGRVGGDDRGSFFEIFKAQCGTMFRLAKDKTGRDQLEPIDHDGNPLIGEQGAVSSADLIEDLRGHAVLGFLFQQRGGPFPNAMPDRSFDGSDDPVNLQAMSSSELYLAAVRKTTPTARAAH
ncbi:hypothetical protein KBZ18_10140 [Synechococcus sp. Cruz-9H2]|uniref:hypothetical protein n=1 Tax=unclassified Synechococcus TaxID=2626047 RepID=UPI0020CCF420|nr:MULTISPECIES: hypothetical protein [unclassified Synechococcus]MCP9819852.1 hypothetical protein [Synechococcus sp. Cruz-9H2]MCP9844082.1 hypothetical protein [Synechococcus sp. Edmonson 11F2]MCP9856282.1 hypothetical protein [Synechococcus sp. Cruz-9C9]MCP9863567.1 hypothetical protein [Synechococcus sp. Cruz-7E5]MCP9870763.1 hypothetical protein [Synechococcus sp. Cruz-7B9]